jgi:hypothetical protein
MEKKYTINEIIERLALTDEEVLLCKQHREYAEKLDTVLDARDFRMDRMDIIGQNGNDGLHYNTDSEGNILNWHKRSMESLGKTLGEPPE